MIRSQFPATLAAGACAALGLMWVIEPAIAPFWYARLGLAVIGMAACGGVLYLARHSQRRTTEDAGRFFDLLVQVDPRRSSPDSILESLPNIEPDHAWRPVFDKLRECFQVMAEHGSEAETARAGAEVRARRFAAERDQIKDILAGLADPVLAVDQYGEITLANPSAQQLLGIDSLAGEHTALNHLDRCQELIGLLNETRRRRVATQRSGELAIVDEEGMTSWYRIACRPLLGRCEAAERDRGANHGAVAVLTDISSLKAVQKRNAEFVSAASHEMKTPLASIRAYLELLEDGDAADEKQRDEFFGIIRSQTDRLQRLIENLLNLARIEAGVVSVNKAARSLNELLTEASSLLEPAAEEKDIKLTTDLSPLYLGVLADRDTMLQAAINLISNAIKYTRPGGSVIVRSRLADQTVVFEVQDTGIGLSPEDCTKVFEKFYRVAKDKEMAPGTGLGLPLVKHIVEDIHGGRIEVESKPLQGSTFRVVLPGVTQISS
jgi:two-component system phosphate regulon sensor histidine kinase PhoR